MIRRGRPYPSWVVQGFQEILDYYNMIDMDLQGYLHTWEMGHGTASWVEVRLERVLLTVNFTNYFKDARLINFEVSTSNHTTILLGQYIVPHSILGKKFMLENV